MTKLVIFDCDGTLVDSELLCNKALAVKLELYGVKACPQELLSRFRGMKMAIILREVESQYSIQLPGDFVIEYRALLDRYYDEFLQPCAGVAEILASTDLPVCVASSGPLAKIRKALQVTGLSGYFGDHLFSAYDVNSWKPDPGLFLHASAVMGFKPEDCLVVEDSDVGIEAARAAGMSAVLYDPDGIYADEGFEPRIQHMSQLTGYIRL